VSRERFTAVVNPAAGAGRAATTMIGLARALRELGADVRVVYSRSLGHATELAAEAAGDTTLTEAAGDAAPTEAAGRTVPPAVPAGAAGRTVLAVGGDGLVGAVAAALAGTATELAVVPAGRGNDLARALPPLSASDLLGVPSRAIDVAEANGRVVIGSLCAGLDAAANDAANRWRLPRRPIAYQLAAAGVLARWRPVDYDLVIDGEPMRLRGHTVVVANCPFYGGAFRVAPAARLDDGLLDLVTIGDVARHRIVPVLAAMRRGTHVNLPGITARRIREITIGTSRPTPIYADGEPLPAAPVTVRVRPAAVRLIGA
jgi:diacylglycerol kinase (ATP)